MKNPSILSAAEYCHINYIFYDNGSNPIKDLTHRYDTTHGIKCKKKPWDLLPLWNSKKQTDIILKNLHYVCDEYTHYLGNMFNNHGT